MEKFSESKIGRPSFFKKLIFNDEEAGARMETACEGIFSNEIQMMTRRNYQNLQYSIHAEGILRNDKSFNYEWLLGIGQTWRNRKMMILSELERLVLETGDEEDMIKTARWICETKPRTTDIIKSLRAVRIDFREIK